MGGTNGVAVKEKVLAAIGQARAAGEPVPGRRVLAQQIGESEHRVRAALRQLEPPPAPPSDPPADTRDNPGETRALEGEPPASPVQPPAPDRPTLSTLAARAISRVARWVDGPGEDDPGDPPADSPAPSPIPPTKPPAPVPPPPASEPAPVVGEPPAVTSLATHPGEHPPEGEHYRPPRPWPLILIGLAAAVAVWGGWVDIGRMTGFGVVSPLPGVWDDLHINTAIVLPIGIEAYAAYALRVWLSSAHLSTRTRGFARWSAWASLAVGAGAQVASHLMRADGLVVAPPVVTVAVACVPVAVLGLATGLATLVRQDHTRAGDGR